MRTHKGPITPTRPTPPTLYFKPVHEEIMSKILPEDEAWRARADRVIASIAKAAWQRSQFRGDGTRIKNPQPYTLPPQVDELVRALAFNDKARASAVFRELRQMATKADAADPTPSGSSK